MAYTSKMQQDVQDFFASLTLPAGYTRVYSRAKRDFPYPFVLCEDTDTQDYTELGDGSTTATKYNLLFAIGAKVAPDNQYATLTTALTGDNNDLVFTAITAGDDGNLLSIKYQTAEFGDPLSVDVSGTDYTVNFVDGVTTAKDIADYFAANYSDVFTVANADGNDGSGFVIAMPKTNLTGGITHGEIYTKDQLQKAWEDIFEPANYAQRPKRCQVTNRDYIRAVEDGFETAILLGTLKLNKSR